MGDSRELNSPKENLTHVNSRGEVHIVDIAEKTVSKRCAEAESWVEMSACCWQALQDGDTPKGDVLATVRLAAVMATKRTSDLIPLCHPLPVESVSCEIDARESGKVRIVVSVSTSAKTGVEMEALTGASVAALTLYDMLKALDKSMAIGPTRLLRKTGGKSGDYVREGDVC